MGLEFGCKEILAKIKVFANPRNVEGMARFGIVTKAYGVSMPNLKVIANEVGKNHELALQLWQSGYYEGRVVASLIDDLKKVTEEQMEVWVRDFDNWAVCDSCCMHLFHKTRFAYDKAIEWSTRDEEFVKRAGYVLMAVLAVHDKKASNSEFLNFLNVIKNGASDERNFVKKAVNWALRQIGKRNLELNKESIMMAKEIHKLDSVSAKWIASDALRELTSNAVKSRLKKITK